MGYAPGRHHEIMAVGKVNREFTGFFTDPMRISGEFRQNISKILDRAGGRCGTLGLRKSRTVTSDLLANAYEISGKNPRNLDRRVGRVVQCHTEEQKTKLLQNSQQCPKLNGKSEFCDIYFCDM